MGDSIDAQRAYWNRWNATYRAKNLSEISTDQRNAVLGWLTELGRTNLDLIEVGCGAGWLCPSLKMFGRVTATDFSDEMLTRASALVPDVRFVEGDFMALDFGAGQFDVVVTLEVLAHVADQQAFIAKLEALLRPGGLLILATQNRPILERFNTVEPQQPGQLRRWVDRNELRHCYRLISTLQMRVMTPVAGNGPMRLSRTKMLALLRVVGRSIERTLERSGSDGR
jgi:2-polyprenyl-3-methyl-5-hydroxy-6-metoxy-1,4-benzoquinol methylase